MSDEQNPKSIKYYELTDIMNILKKYAQESDSELLSLCYKTAIENIKKILETL